MECAPSKAESQGGQVAPSITVDWEGPALGNGTALMAVGLKAREVESAAIDRRLRLGDRMEDGAIKGAQQSGTVSGFGAENGSIERGRRR